MVEKVVRDRLHFSFHLYIYPPDSQKSDGDATHRASNYPNLLPEMPRHCYPVKCFYFGFLLL